MACWCCMLLQAYSSSPVFLYCDHHSEWSTVSRAGRQHDFCIPSHTAILSIDDRRCGRPTHYHDLA